MGFSLVNFLVFTLPLVSARRYHIDGIKNATGIIDDGEGVYVPNAFDEWLIEG